MTESCPGCGLCVAAGRAGCQALYDGLAARALANPAFARWQVLAFDSYCMQHLETYCQSPKSYAAHLTRLCCGLEYNGDAQVYAAIQRWLNGAIVLDKPARLNHLGSLTVEHAAGDFSAEAFGQRVLAWARNVWEAYTPQHELARAWIDSARQTRFKLKGEQNR
jgi:hypothetical protein